MTLGIFLTALPVAYSFSKFAISKRLSSFPNRHTSTWRRQRLPTITMQTDASTSSCPIREDRIELSNGLSMQVLSSAPEKRLFQPNDNKPVLLFLHGSFHAAWCWTEHYFDYFTSKGYTVVAPSWRGTGGTFAGEGVKKVKISEHVEDLRNVLNQLPTIVGQTQPVQPVVVAHSFGGLAVMKLLELDHAEKPFRGVVTMCSVPPSGNGKMTMRFLRRSLSASYKITVGFAMKKCNTNKALCRELFFGGNEEESGISDEELERYQQYFNRDTVATIDLLDLAKQLPSARTDPSRGTALFAASLPPCLVMGAENDFIVDREGLEETALYFGIESGPLVVDSPHDVMLGAKWRNAADALEKWVSETICS